MSPRTRYFLIGSSLVILVGVGAGLVAVYGNGLPLRTSTVGPAELAYVPSNATAIVHANVHDLLGSSLVAALRHGPAANHEKDPVFTSTGIDLDHDIDSVTASFTQDASGHGAPISLLRGRFDQKKIEGFATEHGAVAEDYAGKRLLSIPDGQMPSMPTAGSPDGKSGESGNRANSFGLAFLEPGLVAIGDMVAIKRAIDTASSRTDVSKNADIMKLVADVDSGGMVWAVGQFDAVAHVAPLPEAIKSQIPALQWVAVTARIDDHISGRVHAEAADPKAADNLRGVVNGAIAAARMMAAQNPKLDAALNGFQATGTGKTIEVTFSVPADAFQAFQSAMPSAAPGWQAPNAPRK